MELLQRQAKTLARELNDLTHKKNDLGILIPVDQIVTISLYHADIHQKYFVPRENTSPQIGPKKS
jgi:predicted metallo-beta-lactamase superfamily hydrolase